MNASTIARLVACATAAACAVAACTFGALDDLTGGADAGAGDTGAASDAGTSSDGDAASAADSGGGDAGDAGRWCERQATPSTFCDDFDIGSLTYGWQDLVNRDAGTTALDEMIAASPPRSFAVTTPGFAGQGWGGPFLMRIFPAGPRTISFAADVRVDAVDPAAGPAVWLMSLGLAGSGQGVRYEAVIAFSRTSGWVVVEALPDATYPQHTISSTLPVPGQFYRLAIEYAVAPSGVGGSWTATVDGKSPVSNTVTASSAYGDVTLLTGIEYAQGPSGPWAVHVDDVTVDTQ